MEKARSDIGQQGTDTGNKAGRRKGLGHHSGQVIARPSNTTIRDL